MLLIEEVHQPSKVDKSAQISQTAALASLGPRGKIIFTSSENRDGGIEISASLMNMRNNGESFTDGRFMMPKN